MPLDRAHVTLASRIMLPTYAIMYLTLGLLFIFQDPERTSAPAFKPAQALFPVNVWGLIFLAVGILVVTSLFTHSRKLVMWALTVGVGLVGFWGCVMVMAAVMYPEVSFTSSVWILGWLAAHAATVRSLAVRERQ